MESLCRFGPEIPDRVAESLSESLDIVLCLLQTVQEGEESVAGFVATRRSIGRSGFDKARRNRRRSARSVLTTVSP